MREDGFGQPQPRGSLTRESVYVMCWYPRWQALAVLLLLLIAVVTGSKYRCTDAGPCVHCGKSELDEEDCRATGRRQPVLCIYGEGKEKEDYRSCNVTADDEQVRVMIFQLVMGVLGGLALYGVQQRKLRVLTLFDHRRKQAEQLREQRGEWEGLS